MTAPQSILSRPINVFSLPPEVLDNLAVRSIQDVVASTEPGPSPSLNGVADRDERAGQRTGTKMADQPVDQAAVGGLRCQTCPNAVFETPEEQREHFKSDWHRYNAKARLTGRAVTSEEWDEMVEGVSSISGSASSSSSGSSLGSLGGAEGDQSRSKLSRLLARQHLDTQHHLTEAEEDEQAELEDRRRRAQLRTAVIWFQPFRPLDSLGVPKETQLGVYRALFPPLNTAAEYLEHLKRLQLTKGSNAGLNGDGMAVERRITLLMVAGGHFAGMVVLLRPRGKSEKQEVKGAGDVMVLKHKTFHRYTTRKKQGGSQALNDNAKSKAVSAGAMLRRYGEQALQEDIRSLMSEWEEDIAASEKVFIRASTHGKKSFWGYEGAVLEKNDERIRVFPFPTRRPTLQELLRCWHELVRVKVSHLSEEALAAMDEAYIQSLQPKRQPQQVVRPAAPLPVPTPQPPKLSPEEGARRDRSRRIDEMIRKGRLEPLQALLERYPEDLNVEHLGAAASTGQEEVIRFILVSTTLDPSIPLETGKRAYDLCSTKGARNVFRRVAHEYPDKHDWSAARVPSGLSEEAEAAQEKKKADRRKGLREKMKERQAAQAASRTEETTEEPEMGGATNGHVLEVDRPDRASNKGPQRLGGGKPGGAGEGLAGLSGDMKAQIERERRARAAEARFKGST